MTNWVQADTDTLQTGMEFIGKSIAKGGITCVSSVMLRSDLVAGEAFVPEDGPYCDLALWLRVAARSDVGFLAAPLSAYRVHTGSASTGFHTHRRVFGRTVATMHHADALLLAHSRFIERADFDERTREELRELLQHSDHQMRLSVRLNETLPPLVIRAVKRLARWGRPGRLYSSLSLYSAYSPEPYQVATAGGPRQ